MRYKLGFCIYFFILYLNINLLAAQNKWYIGGEISPFWLNMPKDTPQDRYKEFGLKFGLNAGYLLSNNMTVGMQVNYFSRTNKNDCFILINGRFFQYKKSTTKCDYSIQDQRKYLDANFFMHYYFSKFKKKSFFISPSLGILYSLHQTTQITALNNPNSNSKYSYSPKDILSWASPQLSFGYHYPLNEHFYLEGEIGYKSDNFTFKTHTINTAIRCNYRFGR